jgi:two-component system, OmpR family, sensor histidine kinase KdpD
MQDRQRQLAHTAGLRELDTPRLEDVDRRRAQLWLLSLLVGLAIPCVIVVLGFDWLNELVDVSTLRLALLALLVAVFGYVAERERALRHLTTLLVDERVLTASLVSRVEELDLMLTATRAMNSSLELPRVLEVILTSAYDLLQAEGGSIQLVCADDPGYLEVAAVRGKTQAPMGSRQAIGEGLAGGVASAREALLVVGRTEDSKVDRRIGSAMVVPLEVRGELAGVLNLDAGDERAAFTEFDLRSVAVFAEAAAGAIANARTHGSAREEAATLAELDRAKDEFLAMVTHELRSPLTSIIGIASTLMRGADELTREDIRMLAETSRAQGWRLDRLLQNLVQSSDARRRSLTLRPSLIDTREAVHQTVLALRETSSEHTVTLALPDEPLLGCYDGDALAQITANLVGNALNYTPAGTEIVVTLAAWTSGVTLAVTDDGPGIPPEERERVFAKFQRGATREDDGSGLGLGLYLVRSLAEAHGGRAHMAPVTRRGSRFVVLLADLGEGAGDSELSLGTPGAR